MFNHYNFQEDETILPKTNYSSPFYTAVPLQSHPTDVLAKRFELWRQIIKSLVNYFKSIAIANQQYSKINDNLIQTIHFPFFTNISPKVGGNMNANNKIYEPHVEDLKKQTYFAQFGNGSIQDIQILLKKYHLNLGEQQKTIALELMNVLVPRLEELQRDLFNKIREIKNLTSDFKNQLNQEIAITGQYLNDYIDVVRAFKDGNYTVNDAHNHPGKRDPYLLRLKLEIQLKQQLYQENYLEEAFINLQITGLELEKIIYQELQNSFNRYNELISQEIFVMYNDLINELHQGVISKTNHFEWDEFIERDSTNQAKKHFLTIKHDDELPIPRKLSSIKYPFSKDPISKCLRSGYFNKKSKLLKNYSKSFFILTVNYLHEFKSSNLIENFIPINSIKLDNCILTESNEMKFTLHVKYFGADKKLKTHNFVFKRIPNEMDDSTFKKWIIDLKNMTSFNSFDERFRFINGKLSNSNSRSNTPMFEVSNPMENLDRINEKLQGLTITSITNEASGEHKDTRPTIPSRLSSEIIQQTDTQIDSQTTPQTIPNFSTSNGDTDKFFNNTPSPPADDLQQFQQNITQPKLTLQLPNQSVPQVQVEEPTPIKITPSQDDVFKMAVQHNQSHSRPPSIQSSNGSSSIAIGNMESLKKQKSHIDLTGSLYKGNEEHTDEGLNKVLDALKQDI